jgi:hypothetical protein
VIVGRGKTQQLDIALGARRPRSKAFARVFSFGSAGSTIDGGHIRLGRAGVVSNGGTCSYITVATTSIVVHVAALAVCITVSLFMCPRNIVFSFHTMLFLVILLLRAITIFVSIVVSAMTRQRMSNARQLKCDVA